MPDTDLQNALQQLHATQLALKEARTKLEDAESNIEFYKAENEHQKDLLATKERQLEETRRDAKLFVGIAKRAETELDKINTIARSFGWGQGKLDDDLAGYLDKSITEMRNQIAGLVKKLAELGYYKGSD